MASLADDIRSQARLVRDLLDGPQNEQTDDQLQTAAGDLLVSVADGFALLVAAADTRV